MKVVNKYLSLAAVLICLFSAASCEKQGVARFKGNYSFKTSGSITVVRDEEYVNDTTYRVNGFQIDTLVTVHDEEMTLSVNNETGQMDITSMDGNNLVISMNVIGGEMVLYYASAEGEDLTIDETYRHLTLASYSLTEGSDEFGTKAIAADITVNGSAQRYENIVIFNLNYAGDFWANDRLYHIVDSDIICRAKLNE